MFSLSEGVKVEGASVTVSHFFLGVPYKWSVQNCNSRRPSKKKKRSSLSFKTFHASYTGRPLTDPKLLPHNSKFRLSPPPPPPHTTATLRRSCTPRRPRPPIFGWNQVYCGSSTPQNRTESRANTRRRPPHATRRRQATTAHNKQTKPQVMYHHLSQRRASSDVTHIRRRPAPRTVPPSAKSTTKPANVAPGTHHLPLRGSKVRTVPPRAEKSTTGAGNARRARNHLPPRESNVALQP